MTITLTVSNLATPTTLVNGADVTTPDNELLTILNNIVNGAQSSEQLRFDQIATPSSPAAGKNKLYFKSDDHVYKLTSAGVEQQLDIDATHVCNARLTLATGLPVPTGDAVAAATIYVTPAGGSRMALYTSSLWKMYTFTEITISLTGFTADKNYDVFCYDNGSGVVIAETVVWTNDSTRATALTKQDGVYVKSGSVNKRYIGTFRTTSTLGQTEDSVTKRYVWNYYNRVQRDLFVTEATDSWTYATATWHAWNASNSNRVSFVRGVSEESMWLDLVGGVAGTSAAGALGIGLDSTSTPTKIFMRQVTTTSGTVVASYVGQPAEGFHFLQLLEFANAGTATFIGDGGVTFVQSGGIGSLAA